MEDVTIVNDIDIGRTLGAIAKRTRATDAAPKAGCAMSSTWSSR